MRIFLHDFAGHPFPLPLSRALAARGHTVLHCYCASLQTTPRGSLDAQPDDPATFHLEGLSLGAPLEKYALVKRWRQERAYGKLVAEAVTRFRPEVVLSGNTPLDAQKQLLQRSHALGARFLFWVQDLIGIATERLLEHKSKLLGMTVGQYYVNLERRLLTDSDAVVLITPDFGPIMEAYHLPRKKVHVIENWAPLDEVPVRPKHNAWADRHGLSGKKCLIYTGTLGMKHNPELLLQLAAHFREDSAVRVVVISQGKGADWLTKQKAERKLENLLILGFQPFEVMPDVLAAADVLLAVLEPDAGIFSVPSKVLTYLCAARPVLLAVPPENLAARIVARHEAGRVVSPRDADGFVQAAGDLLADEERWRQMGRNARRYAEQTFDIEKITDAFEYVLSA